MGMVTVTKGHMNAFSSVMSFRFFLAEMFIVKVFIDGYINASGSPTLFTIGGFYRTQNETQWTVVKHCEPTDSESILQLPEYISISILKVSTSLFQA